MECIAEIVYGTVECNGDCENCNWAEYWEKRKNKMDRLLSESAVLEAVSNGCREWRGIYKRCEENIKAISSTVDERVDERVDETNGQLTNTDIPSRADGYWKKISPAGIYECSKCGQNVKTQDICAYHFCHGCGIKINMAL